jgi:hypothetical protein
VCIRPAALHALHIYTQNYLKKDIVQERQNSTKTRASRSMRFPGGNTMGVSAISTSVPKTAVATFATYLKAEEVAGKPLSEHQTC